MAFRLFLICSFVLLARPQDILTFLQPLRPALLFLSLAVAAVVFGGQRGDLKDALTLPESKRYLLLYAIMVIGIPFSWNKGVALHGVFSYIINVLFFVLLVSQITSLDRLKALIWVISLSSLAYSFFGGLIQIGGAGEGRFNLAGDVFDANDTAYVLVSLFPLSFFFVRFNEGLVKRIVAVTAICGSIAIILMTGSRGGLLALGSVFLILLLTKTGGVEKRYKILLLIMVVATSYLMSDRINMERYSTLTDLSSDYNMSDEEGRVQIWKGAIGLTADNPFTGVGVECFDHAWMVARQEMDSVISLRQKSIHNSILQVAVEVGLIGFGVYMFIVLRSLFTFIRVNKARSQSHRHEIQEISAAGGLMTLGFVGLLVSGFFLSQGYSIFSTLYFGLAAVINRIQRTASYRESAQATSSIVRPEEMTSLARANFHDIKSSER